MQSDESISHPTDEHGVRNYQWIRDESWVLEWSVCVFDQRKIRCSQKASKLKAEWSSVPAKCHQHGERGAKHVHDKTWSVLQFGIWPFANSSRRNHKKETHHRPININSFQQHHERNHKVLQHWHQLILLILGRNQRRTGETNVPANLNDRAFWNE